MALPCLFLSRGPKDSCPTEQSWELRGHSSLPQCVAGHGGTWEVILGVSHRAETSPPSAWLICTEKQQ